MNSSLISKARLIAFYLPQYHPIPENNAWWGKGFTEWTNVVRARPLFKGHYQPHFPADLGFYDLRMPEVRQAQADLAREYGIHGFCYYHYWFNGQRVLERPFNEVLESKKPDFPFCLCWANENWTRAWDGRSGETILTQAYSEEDDLAHIQWLAGVFKDARYIRVQGKPLFLVYRASQIPNPNKTISIWREEAKRLGIGDLFLCRVESFPNEKNIDPETQGFDASVEFQPDWSMLGKSLRSSKLWRVAQILGVSKAFLQHRIFDYGSIVDKMIQKSPADYLRFPCVTPSWDNTPRRNRSGVIFKDSSPEKFGKWLRDVIARILQNKSLDNIVFVNAWNEWAEGNHLEPCQRWGLAYLEEVRSAIEGQDDKNDN